VEGVKNLAAVAQRYHWPRVAALGITQHSYCAEGDELEAEAGVSGCLDGRAVALGLGDGGLVQRLGGGRHCGDGCSCLWRARQCVGHHVVLPGNVPDVTCELRHVAEVAALAGEGEWLVVCVQREPPPLRRGRPLL
jgi:hypothetical protein